MSDVDDEGGDPACWLHLFEEDEEDEEVEDEDAPAQPSGVEARDGDAGGDRPSS
jgi:hypothetical protein